MPNKESNKALMSASIGVRKDRLMDEYSGTERTFVSEWHKFNKDGRLDIIDALLSVPCDSLDPKRLYDYGLCWNRKYSELGPPTERDRIVAETVIQWLGTNVGQAFLNKCGFTKIYTE